MKIYLTPLALIALIAPLHARTQHTKNIKTAIAQAKTELKQSHAKATDHQKTLRHAQKSITKNGKAQADLEAKMRGNQSIITIIDRTLSHFRDIEKDLISNLDHVIEQHEKKMGDLDRELRRVYREIQNTFKKLHKKETKQAHKQYKALDKKHTQLTINRDVHQGTLNTLKKIKAIRA